MIAERTVAWLTWRQLFARKRLWLALAIAVLPWLLTFFYRFMSEDREGDRFDFMIGMYRDVLLAVLLPITAVVFGTTAFGGEVDDGTLLYLIAKPVQRWRIVLVKFLVALAVTLLVTGVAITLPWLALRNEELTARFLFAFLAAGATSALIYCGLFTLFGLVTRRGLIAGLLYVVFFENVMARSFAGIQSFSARALSVAVAQYASDGLIQWPADPVSRATVWTMGTVILAVGLGLAMWKLSRYELAERL